MSNSFCIGEPPPIECTLLHIEVQLPILLRAIKTVEGDFQFCWAISPNIGQTHKEKAYLDFLYDIYIK